MERETYNSLVETIYDAALNPDLWNSAVSGIITCMQGSEDRWLHSAGTGLNDADMAQAVRYELGISGGSGCRDSINIHYEGAGFKVWAAWECFNHCLEEPIFQGNTTIKAARLLFGVKNTNDVQLDLF